MAHTSRAKLSQIVNDASVEAVVRQYFLLGKTNERILVLLRKLHGVTVR